MYTLYGMTGSCSMAIHAVLNELGQAFDYVDVRVPEGQPRPAEFLKINPRGNVPVLVDDGHAMREGGAIIAYLLDKHNSPMLPKSGPARATALEWLMFANATMHPAYGRLFFINRVMAEGEEKTKAFAAAVEAVNKLWADVDAQLANQPYVCGEQCSAADILLSVIANWGKGGTHGGVAEHVVFGPNLQRMLKAVSTRDSFAKALEKESVHYNAAA